MYFCFLFNYLHLEKGGALRLKKIHWIPIIHLCFVLSLVEPDKLVLEIFFFNVNCQCLFLLSPLGKRCGPSFEQILLIQACLVIISPVVLEGRIPFTKGCFVWCLEKMKMWIIYDYNGKILIRKGLMSLWFRWAIK